MINTKNKKLYTMLQIKLFDYSKMLDDLFDSYIKDPSNISYKKIVNLNNTINNLMNESTRLQDDIIYYELLG